jgi:uncharacterized protein (TIRG00374 family)
MRAGQHANSRSLGLGIVGIAASAVFLYLATRGLDPAKVEHAVRRAGLLELAAATTAMAVVYTCQAARWRRIVGAQRAIGIVTALRLVISAVAVNNVVPGRPGEVLRAYWLSRATALPLPRAFATVVVDRLSDVLVLVTVLLVSYPFVPHPAWLQEILSIALPMAAALLLGLAACRWYVGHRSRGGRPVPAWLRRRWIGRVLGGMVHSTAASVNRSDALAIGALSVGAWGGFAAGAWLVGDALGIDVSLPQLIFLLAVVNLGVALPSSPGFIGTYQWLCVAALGLFGTGKNEAFAFSILLQAVWYVPTTLAGLAIAAQGVVRRVTAPPVPATPPSGRTAQEAGG